MSASKLPQEYLERFDDLFRQFVKDTYELGEEYGYVRFIIGLDYMESSDRKNFNTGTMTSSIIRKLMKGREQTAKLFRELSEMWSEFEKDAITGDYELDDDSPNKSSMIH
jgi:hypothetical protein